MWEEEWEVIKYEPILTDGQEYTVTFKYHRSKITSADPLGQREAIQVGNDFYSNGTVVFQALVRHVLDKE